MKNIVIFTLLLICALILFGLSYSYHRNTKNTTTNENQGLKNNKREKYIRYGKCPETKSIGLASNTNFQDIYNFGRVAHLQFLDYSQAKKIFDENSICHSLTPEEIQLKLHPNVSPSLRNNTWTNTRQQWVEMCCDQYTDNILNFRPNELSAIGRLYNQSRDENKLKIPKSISRIKFIKINGNLDWNYPYTIGEAIVLPRPLIEQIRRGFMSVDEFASLINHELIHIDQRINQSKYDRLYSENNIIQVPTSDLITSVKLATNPDDPVNLKTVYPITNNTYILTSLVYDSRRLLNEPIQMAIEMIKRPDGRFIQKNEDSYWLMGQCPYLPEIMKRWKNIRPSLTPSDFKSNGYSANEIMAIQ
jgi:hypothetical protein